jgi:hypothetical protein
MTHKALLRQLQISCLGLDAVDPLRLLVDDVIAALAQTERTWVGLTDEEENEYNYLGPDMHWVIQEIAAKLKQKNTHD